MKSVLSVAVAWALLFGLRAAGSEAITSYTVDGAYGGYVPGGAGFAFAPQTNMAITALGFNGTGLPTGPYRVGLWANGRQLVSAVVTANSSLLNQTYYEAIPAVQLVQGQTYHLSAAGTNSGLWVGNLIQTGIPPQSFSVSADIAYIASAYGTNSSGEFPSGTGDVASYYVAPNFQYLIGGGTNLVWAATTTNQWDIGTSFNWVNLANNLSDRFFNGEAVLFDDRPGVLTNVSIAAGVSVVPLVMTNNSSTNNFAFSGAGQISGTAVIVKDGTSTLTLATTNDFTGNLVVLGGTVKVGCPGALGATNGATLVTNSATLDLNGMNIGFEPVILSGSGVSNRGAIVNNGPPLTTGLQRLTLAGDTTLGGSNRWDLGGVGPAALLTSGNAWSITKTGTNQVSLVAVNLIDAGLADIDIQQGTFSLQSTTAQLGNPNRTLTVRSNATLSLNNLAAAPLNKQIVLNDGAAIANEQGPSVIAGPVTLNGTNIFSVSALGSAPTLTLNSALSGTGSIWKVGAGRLVLNATNTYTGSTLVNTGIVALTGSGTLASSAAIVLSPGTFLDVSARGDARLTLASGQLLKGDGTILGSLTAGVGSTVSPGIALGLLTVTNDIVLQGTTFMELNKAALTNDVLQAGTNIAYGGTLSLTNLSGALAVGDRFKLFSAAAYTGAFTNITPLFAGPGLGWDISQLITNGTLGIMVASPVITNITASGTNLVIAGINGTPTNSYYVLTSTNLALPLTNWARITTNLFDTAGNFIFTNAFNRAVPEQFYLLQLP